MRVPADHTYRKLLILGNGAIVVVPRKKDWRPLLDRGWVEAAWETGQEGLPPLRITPEGLRALADWLERTGPLPLPKGRPPLDGGSAGPSTTETPGGASRPHHTKGTE